MNKNSLQARGYDQLDLTILEELQMNCRISVTDLARKIHLSQPAVHNRIKRLERDGVIRQYVALLDRQAVGYGLVCFLRISLQPHSRDVFCDVQARLGALGAVQEIYRTTGGCDLLVKAAVADHEALDRLLNDHVRTIYGIERIDVEIVLNEVKHSTAYQLKD